MRRVHTIFLGASVVAACLAGAPATAREAATVRIVGMLPSGSPVAPQAAQAAADCLPLPRAESDRPDFDSGRQVHLIYLVPADAADEALDVDGTLECSIRAQQQWVAEQTEGLEWRLDTFLTEVVVDGQKRTVAAPDVTFVASPQPAENLDSGGAVRQELRARGFDDPDKRYLTYVESGSGRGICGDALYPIPRLGERWGGQYAQVYLNSSEGCGSDEFGVPGAPSFAETVAQQELMHNDGMTPPGAPHACLLGFPPGIAHVCTVAIPIPELDPERFDVMYPFAGIALSEKKLDIGHDDYFRHGLPIEDFADTPFLRPVADRPTVPGGNDRSVSLRTSRTAVTSGQSVRLSGTLAGSSCVSGAEVVVEQRRPGGSFTSATTTPAADDGSFSARVRVERTTIFRAVATEAGGCPQAISPEVRIRATRG